PAEWESIAALFPAQRDAARERSAIARAIGRFEEIVGARNGTSADKSGTFAGTGKTGQHDCIDESTNTTMYLTLLEKEGILRFHGVSGPLSRTPFTTLGQGKLWPHQTAVIREIADGKSYAVDSWFHDNGHPAEIVPLATWRAGWAPGD
ncbi:MAG: hypothetical protein KDJ15_01650, partial [Alphaproteobacteria bacterium]|nr:hypothetical protein [Alphaproteobacteria bacterium]